MRGYPLKKYLNELHIYFAHSMERFGPCLASGRYPLSLWDILPDKSLGSHQNVYTNNINYGGPWNTYTL